MNLSIPVADRDELNRLPRKAARTLESRLAALRAAKAAHDAGTPLVKALQAQAKQGGGLSFASLKRCWAALAKPGTDWRAIVDGRAARTKSKAPADAVRLTDLRQWARGLYAANKRALLPAWRAGMRQLMAGETIPGLGTWRELHRRLYPARPVPPSCPWSTLPGQQPPRLSASNFYRLAQTPAADRALAALGSGAARASLAGLVEFDTSTLRPLEFIVFDDVRLDFMIADPATGQICELWGLVAMDVATRMILRYGLRARRRRPDGTKESLTKRDMRHLFVGLLCKEGLPMDWQMTFIVENAAAAVTDGDIAALATIGVAVRRTPVTSGNLWLDAWGESATGNPRAKGWLESTFNLLHNEAATIPGQTGATYQLRHSALDPAVAHAQKLLTAAESLPLTERHLRSIPFKSFDEARRELDAIFHAINQRRRHSLAGFEPAPVWRWRGQSHWMEWDEFPQNLPPEAMAQIETLTVMESPAMRMQRLSADMRRHSMPDSAAAAFLMDHSVISAHKNGILTIQAGGNKTRFDAAHLTLPDGAPVTAWYDAGSLDDGILLTDPAGRFIGRAHRTTRVPICDTEAMAAAIKRKQQALSASLERVRSDTLTPERLAAQSAAIDADMTLVSAAAAILPPAAADPAAAPGARAVSARAKRSAKSAAPIDVDAVLRHRLANANNQ